ncbi:MAG: ATP-binding cassette domain-containing protein [Psychromonas sp.]|nr:ATP-binding cassette domain-containing protein [Psychromonas sp.]
MSKISNISNIEARLEELKVPAVFADNDTVPLDWIISTWLTAMRWEGSPDKLSDFLVSNKNSSEENITETMLRLGYQTHIVSGLDFDTVTLPFYFSGAQCQGLVIQNDDNQVQLLDPFSGNLDMLPRSIFEVQGSIIAVEEYSRYFKELPPATADKSNWLKYSFFKFQQEINLLIVVSFLINLMGLVTPFYIMAIYSMALGTGSYTTLGWIALGALLGNTFEYILKNLRVKILMSSGSKLAERIAFGVFKKIMWLPYLVTTQAGSAVQSSRLKDIDQFRKIVTNQATLAYLDLPFIFIYLIALIVIVGKGAFITFIGIGIFIVFGFYSRLIFQSQMIKSSVAGELKRKSWLEILKNAESIQRLPMYQMLKLRFGVANKQAEEDSVKLANIQNAIADSGAFLTQMIGIVSIVMVVIAVMEGEIDPSAMLAMVILIWKALGPLQSIYNTIIKMRQLGKSGAQINNVMRGADNEQNVNTSIPLKSLDGKIELEEVGFRHVNSSGALAQISATILPGEIVTIVSPSGGGKSTLLKILGGLYDNFYGSIYIDGLNFKQFNSYIYRNCITYAPQKMSLFSGSIRENFYLSHSNINEQDMLSALSAFKLEEWFKKGLDTELTDQVIDMMPAGILTRLMLAIVVCKPKGIVILDDPGFELDQDSAFLLKAKLKDLSRTSTVIIATQKYDLIKLSDKTLQLDENGTQIFFGSPDRVLDAM